MKFKIITLSLLLSFTVSANIINRDDCGIVVNDIDHELQEILISKGYIPIVKDEIEDGEMYLGGETNCYNRLGVFKWLGCRTNLRINLQRGSAVARLGIVSEKVEFNYEFSNRYPRHESKVKAMNALPSCR